MSPAIDYEAKTANGVTVATFADLHHARQWLRDRPFLEGAYVEEVQRWEVRRKIGRAQLRVAA